MLHCRVLQHIAQLRAGLDQFSHGAQFLNGGVGIYAAVYYHFSEGTGIAGGNGGHYLPSFPRLAVNSRTSIWSAAWFTCIFFSAKSTARSAAYAFSSRRAALAAMAISCSAD